MRRKLLLVVPVLVAVAALAAWAALRATRTTQEWTTSSPAALAAFEEGLTAERKLYHAEARAHFARAVALDPGFVAARVMLLRTTPAGPGDEAAAAERKALLKDLATQDRTGLTSREAFLLDYHLALNQGRRDDAMSRLQEYLAEHPDDPWALERHCDQLWVQQRFAEAEETYERLLAIDPNWVRAQNNLGYLAMAQGEFAAAEDRFLTYRYVAPDQANPHDSLGELLMLTGRWEDARRELEEALAVRRDFCVSYANLTYLALFTGRAAEVPAILERAAKDGDCGAEWTAAPRCRAELWQQAQSDDWERLADFEGSCASRDRVWPWVSHLAALKTGDVEQARAIERTVAGHMARERVSEDRPLLDHLEGMRYVAEGRVEEGLERLRSTDASLGYFGFQTGVFKLYNRLQWADALARRGDAAAAEEKLREVAAVNPTLAESFRSGELSQLRLGGDGSVDPDAARQVR